MKVLSPAGNFECLKVAVFNGADEVYLGINDFNARNNIDGFTLENLSKAVDFAHIYGVKVCLAINILFLDSELQSALETIVKAYNLGIDAFILQDLGLIKLIRKHYPEIEIHFSTQMAINNLEGLLALKEYGAKRVVLARETPLKEIKRIKENTDIEIEYFVQGALCVSFSGNCYLSSKLYQASGNRGRCKQLCRLPYTLEKDGVKLKKGYLLSAKDFNMSKRLLDLKNAGVDVLKIEGRARRPYYVGATTREYKRAVLGGKAIEENLQLAFNREFTAGYFDGNGNIISNIQNHIGIEVGKVTRVNRGKTFNEIFITSNRDLFPKSTFKIFSLAQERCVITAYDLKMLDENKYTITTTKDCSVGDSVHLIIDSVKEKEILDYAIKRKVDLNLYFNADKKMKATVKIDGEDLEVLGEKLENAKNSPLTKEEIIECFNKSEYFTPNIIKCAIDKVFVQKSKLNEFRRSVYAKVLEFIVNRYKRSKEVIKLKLNHKTSKAFEDFHILDRAKDFNKSIIETNIIYSPEEYLKDDIIALRKACEKFGKNFYLDLPNFALDEDINYLKDLVESENLKIIANNYYALTFDCEKVIGAGLNVYNHQTASCFNYPILSTENEEFGKIDFPLMTLRHCPMKTHLKSTCKNCKYQEGYNYIMQGGNKLKLKRKKLSTCTFYLV